MNLLPKICFQSAVLTIFFLLFSSISFGQDNRNLTVSRTRLPTAEPRIALVIGNGAYKSAPLTNPINDANEMARALRDTGFKVIHRDNATQKEMNALIRDFGDQLSSGGVGVFFYAGHGMQVRGRNYLIPVDAQIEREDEVSYNSVDANLILEKMESARNRLNILILDACRNNPFARSFRSGNQGLAQMDAPVGTLVAFATSPGAVASDGSGKNGLYTKYLLEGMKRQGTKLEDIFKTVRASVRRESEGKQIPWEATSLEGDFYFLPPKEATAAASPSVGNSINRPDSEKAEITFWDSIKTSNHPIGYKAYLEMYPAGKFANLARSRLADPTLSGFSSTAIPLKPNGTAVPEQSKPRIESGHSNNTAGTIELAPFQEAANEAYANSATASVAQQTVISNRPLPAIVFQPGPDQVPLIKKGDRWKYAVIDLWKNEKIREENYEADVVEEGTILFKGGRYRTDRTGMNPITRDPSITNYPYEVNMEFPLIIGKESSGVHQWQSSVTNDRGKVEYSLKTLRQERVTVPAGTFNCYLIEKKFRYYTTLADGRSGSGTGVYHQWYAPEVKRFVKSEIARTDWNHKTEQYERRELTSFTVK